MVVNELRGEKIDIVPFSDDPADFVMKALSPAKVKEVRIHEDTGVAEVIVPDYQLSLAIGKEGQNARLAARLTGWRVDIKSETQLAEEEAYLNQDWAEGEWVVDAETGEQMWKSADGELMTVEQWNEAALAEGEALVEEAIVEELIVEAVEEAIVEEIIEEAIEEAIVEEIIEEAIEEEIAEELLEEAVEAAASADDTASVADAEGAETATDDPPGAS
jgi:N utilization substance protein A